jgi:hypothetical protein
MAKRTPKSAIKKGGKSMTPNYQFDQAGKITNWSSLWPEAIELESLLVSGHLDGLKPAEVRQKYPVFDKFAYRPISSALANLRGKMLKEAKDRENHGEDGGECELLRLLSHLYA